MKVFCLSSVPMPNFPSESVTPIAVGPGGGASDSEGRPPQFQDRRDSGPCCTLLFLACWIAAIPDGLLAVRARLQQHHSGGSELGINFQIAASSATFNPSPLWPQFRTGSLFFAEPERFR